MVSLNQKVSENVEEIIKIFYLSLPKKKKRNLSG